MHLGLLLVLCFASIELTSAAGGTVSPYIDPTQFTATPWGYKSHYTQPWRAWASTVSRVITQPWCCMNHESHHEHILVCNRLAALSHNVITFRQAATGMLLKSSGTVMSENCDENCTALKAKMLASHGITQARMGECVVCVCMSSPVSSSALN